MPPIYRNLQNLESKTIFGIIEEIAILHPSKIVIKHQQTSLTNQDLMVLVDRFSMLLEKKGIKKNDVIMIAMDRSIDMVIVKLGCLRKGITYLNVLPEFPSQRIDYIYNNCNPKNIFTTSKYQSKFETYPNMICFDSEISLIEKTESFSITDSEVADCIAFILFTSGSTGEPKGVELTQKGLLNLLTAAKDIFDISPNDITLQTATVTFDLAQLEIFLPLIAGAQLVISNLDVSRDGRLLIDTIEKEQITVASATPFQWKMIVEAGWNKFIPIKVICGGEPITKDLAKSICPVCKEFWNIYGPTETTIFATLKKITLDDPITIGKTIPNVAIHILDEQLNEVPEGEVGEIFISGIGVGKGYVNKIELTQKAFLDCTIPGALSSKMYKTGDLGKILPNKEIDCLGRKDHQVKIRGIRIELEEIEFHLKQQPNVRTAIVTSYKDQIKNIRLVAYIELIHQMQKEEEHVFFNQLKSSLTTILPEYMVPNNFMIIRDIPYSLNGKINRQALPAPIIEEASREIITPKTILEEQILKIWEKNLGLKQLSVEDDYFELGGDSLIATMIMVQIEKITNKRLPNTLLFQYKTIRQICSVIEHEQTDGQFKALVPIKSTGTKIPLYIVHAYGLNLLFLNTMVSYLDQDQPVYGFQALGLNGKDLPLNDIIAAAEFYNQELLIQNPDGPYLIAGYSLGGSIAFEMVKQLKKKGKDVTTLILFDSEILIKKKPNSIAEAIQIRLQSRFNNYYFRLKTLKKSPIDTFHHMRKKYERIIKKLLNKNYNHFNMPSFMLHIADLLNDSLDGYLYQPLPIKLIQFNASKNMNFIKDPEYLGWKPYALNGIEKYKIPGDHDTMFSAPNDKVLAELLQKKLNEISDLYQVQSEYNKVPHQAAQ